jgi:hypothetical protein
MKNMVVDINSESEIIGPATSDTIFPSQAGRSVSFF